MTEIPARNFTFMSHNEDSERRELQWVVEYIGEKIENLAHLIRSTMSVISDFAAKQKAFNDQQDKAVSDIQTELQQQNDKITQLQNQLAAGQPVSDEDKALLDQIATHSQTLTTQLQALDTLTPPAVPPDSGVAASAPGASVAPGAATPVPHDPAINTPATPTA